jgi:uncharacterized Zn finger protein
MKNITLNNFKTVINPTIINRGEEYFQRGYVNDLDEIDDDLWSAVVNGSDIYSVKIKLGKNKITEMSCDCPYDLGPVCKHEVAALFAIKEKLADGTVTPKKPGKNKKKVERKTVADQINEILANASSDELKEIVCEYAFEDIEFRNVLLTRFIPKKDAESNKHLYRRIIKESLRSGMDRHGFIDYWSGARATKGINELLSQADDMLKTGQLEQAVLIYQTAIEETFLALQHADDSNGDFGDIIRWSFEKLEEVAYKTHENPFRKNLMDYCFEQSLSDTYEGWSDWQWDFIRIASRLAQKDETEIILNKVDELLEKEKASNKIYDKYDQEEAVRIKLDVIKRHRGNAEAMEFMNENLEYTPMRRSAIEIAINNKNYSLAKNLAGDGIKLDTKRGWPGLVNEWAEQLYEIAKKERNIDDIRKYASYLFLEGRGFEYYDRLKKTYSSDEWKTEVDNLIRQLEGARSGCYSTYAEIYIREKRWDDLLSLVKKNISPQIIDTYHKYLEKYFPDELILLYEQAVKKMLEQTTGRGVYQDACLYLRRMKKLGAEDKVQLIIKELREAYKNRRALLEELDNAQ